MTKTGDTQAINLRKLSIEFLHSCLDEQYPSNMTSTHNHRNLLESLRKFIARVSLALCFSLCASFFICAV